VGPLLNSLAEMWKNTAVGKAWTFKGIFCGPDEEENATLIFSIPVSECADRLGTLSS